ncbi:MAG: DivIVA domain-containing protein [Rubrobacter sp.]|jgi:cell division initiation protein|nr:DivIVA domain-containing protein [Rubrobacter sp.]
MAIRPIDVRRKEFSNGFRGYDANQVDDFLDQVADEFERAYTDNQRMREEVSSLRERLQQFEELEGSIRSALVHAEQAANDLRHTSQREAEDLRHSAQREAESLRASSQREAEITIQEAQARAHQMLSDSSSRVERVQDSYEALQDAKQEFTKDFRQLLKTYMDVMEDMEITSAKGIESSLRQRLDTESIAVAREAANSDQPKLTDEGGASGPLYEEEGEGDAAFATDSSSEETQRIDLSELPDMESDESLEAEEPEVEPSTAESDADETVVSDSTGLDREERDEAAFSEGDKERTNADDFFEDSREEGSYDKEAEEEEDSRIFRASRFLRRRG